MILTRLGRSLREALCWRSPAAQERRESVRRDLPVLCTASFRVATDETRAILLDISHTGARFGTATHTSSPAVTPNQFIEYEVTTPFGMTTCRGRVMWLASDDVLQTWGVRFDRSVAPRDPALRELLAES